MLHPDEPRDAYTFLLSFTVPAGNPLSLAVVRGALDAVGPHLPVTATVEQASLTRTNASREETSPSTLVQVGDRIEVRDGQHQLTGRVTGVVEREDAPDQLTLDTGEVLHGIWLPHPDAPDDDTRGSWLSLRGHVILDAPERLRGLGLPGTVLPWPGAVDAAGYLALNGTRQDKPTPQAPTGAPTSEEEHE
ncbi:hypothetical protein [Nocardiopsis sp. FR26]|uniref:hypothetical protein n=1 Tax=Nocardiopsis sp. FR26 TaxID=2605987 RepID=UPI001358F66F|nr:hypothetical protein [Nocardiopsis sp. FR26]